MIFDKIKQKAFELGFDDVGVVRIESTTTHIDIAGRNLKDWVARDLHGEMDWFAKKLDWRTDPRRLWPDVRSIIMLGMSYAPAHSPLNILKQSQHGAISVYAQNQDYHDIVKKRLKALARFMVQEFGEQVKVFVDTAAVMEKPLAAIAGLGWQGKHTNLISRQLGNWFFLGSVFTTLDIRAQTQIEPDHCGSCTKCLNVCPTNAFIGPHEIDARRCISYLTIEYDGIIPVEFRKAIGNRIYGCDDCLAVCPWNKFAQTTHDNSCYWARAELQAPLLCDFLQLDDSSFREIFSKSPVKRIGVHRFLRNVLIAAGNSGTIELVPYIERHVLHENTVVQASAIWALSQLENPDDFDKRIPDNIESNDIYNEWKRQPI